jgi:hypothetical protein
MYNISYIFFGFYYGLGQSWMSALLHSLANTLTNKVFHLHVKFGGYSRLLQCRKEKDAIHISGAKKR